MDIHSVLQSILQSTGIAHFSWGQLAMIALSGLLIWLAIHKEYEPSLLLPIGFAGILANLPLAGVGGVDGILGQIYAVGIQTGVLPLLIFLSIGAMTDFGPMLAQPKTLLLGAAAQVGIFATLLGTLAIGRYVGLDLGLRDAAAIGIIGGADGPTAIILASRMSPRFLGAIAVAAYSYMAMVPLIQPPIMRALTTRRERAVVMRQLREVSRLERILFPFLVTGLCALLLPAAIPIIGMLMLGNILRESGVVDRLSKGVQNELTNIVTIFLGLGVGSKLSADLFLQVETLVVLALGLVAFAVGTAGGVLLGKLMCRLSRDPVNPLIGAAGVSAVPMAARVAHKVGLEMDPNNMLLMHAMGPNVAGQLGSAIAAGVLLALLG